MKKYKEMRKELRLFFSGLVGFFIVSCSNDDDNQEEFTTENLKLEISGLKNIKDTGVYEGWLITPKGPISTGKFSVNDKGALSQDTFLVGTNTINNATKFIITIELKEDPNKEPSATKILAGDFSNKTATLSAKGNITENDFSDIAGEFILATPSTSATNDENKGVWFLNNSKSPFVAGLKLPELKRGWIYEGWAIIEEEAISTGKFSKLNEADNKNEYKGQDNPLPDFPGEDFVQGEVKQIKKESREKLEKGLIKEKGLTKKDSIIIDFSKDKFTLSKVVVTLEPLAEKDDYDAPSPYKIFESDPLDLSTETRKVLSMKNILDDFPTGKVFIESK